MALVKTALTTRIIFVPVFWISRVNVVKLRFRVYPDRFCRLLARTQENARISKIILILFVNALPRTPAKTAKHSFRVVRALARIIQHA